MKIINASILFLTFGLSLAVAGPAQARGTELLGSRDSITDYFIKRGMIAESIQNYQGSCPCPYSLDRAGRKCGDRSAWSRPGAEAPLCYYDEISPWMVEQYKRGLLTR